MRRTAAVVLAVTIATTTAATTTATAAGALPGPLPDAGSDELVIAVPVFEDVPESHPFAGDIRWMWSEATSRGCDPPANDHYCPDRAVSRGEMAVFLARVLDLTEPGRGFADVPEPLADAVGRVAAAGITRGCNPPANDRFCPDRPVTRGEMAAFLVRGFGIDATATPSHFLDVGGSPFIDDIARLAATGISRGCNPPANDRFCPDRPVSRAEMAAFLRRASGDPPPPAVPAGLTFDRTSSGSGSERVVELRVCAELLTGVRVVRALAGGADPALTSVVAFPSAIDISAGTYDSERDVWSVQIAGCATLTGIWNPGVLRARWPVPNPVVVSPFGMRRHPILGTDRLHAGVDLRGRSGDPVRAADTGTVTRAGWWGGYGNVVDVTVPGGVITRYAHLSSIAVPLGARVERGTLLGSIGCTGLCTGPHLHFEIRPLDEPVDPVPLVFGPAPIIDPVPVPQD